MSWGVLNTTRSYVPDQQSVYFDGKKFHQYDFATTKNKTFVRGRNLYCKRENETFLRSQFTVSTWLQNKLPTPPRKDSHQTTSTDLSLFLSLEILPRKQVDIQLHQKFIRNRKMDVDVELRLGRHFLTRRFRALMDAHMLGFHSTCHSPRVRRLS